MAYQLGILVASPVNSVEYMLRDHLDTRAPGGIRGREHYSAGDRSGVGAGTEGGKNFLQALESGQLRKNAANPICGDRNHSIL